jgi:AraC-like DNA-binding protein
VPLDEAGRRAVLSIAGDLKEIADKQEPLQPVEARLHLTRLLLEIMRHAELSRHAEQPELDRFSRIVPAVVMAIESREPVTNAEGAARCDMSVSTFKREFAGLMGVSFSNFGLRQRVGGAAREVAATSNPLKAIAASWGFTDASHFHRVFVKHYGVTPRQYRLEEGKRDQNHAVFG